MTKEELTQAVEKCKAETRGALRTIYDALNHGQQQKILKDEAVKAVFIRYGLLDELGEII